MTTPPDLEERLDAVELLGEPVRRALYLHVARQPSEVSRDDAAAAVKISRELAAFHLDKLAAAGLLEPSFRRLTGRGGPGAGRPAKLYRRAGRQIDVTLPPREYELAARIFARALGLDRADRADDGLDRAAREIGLEAGRRAAPASESRASETDRRAKLTRLLEAHGYEPFVEGGRLRLRNCPFHDLQQEFRRPVCEMNFAFLDGLRAGARIGRVRPVLEPADDNCCVSFGFRD